MDEPMNDSMNNILIDALQSKPVKSYFENMFKEQSASLLQILESAAKKQADGELVKTRAGMEAALQKCQGLESLLSKEQEKSAGEEKKCHELSEACEKLNEDIMLRDKELRTLKSRADEQVAIIHDLQTAGHEREASLKCEIECLQHDLLLYRNKYADVDTAHELYLSFSEEIRQRLRNIFGRGTLYEFVAAASRWDSIEGVWGFAKRRIIEDEKEDGEKLAVLLRFLFTAFCQSFEGHRYELISPTEGERYDSDRHSIKGIKTDGQISALLLDGIYDVESKKVMYKAIVEVQ